MVRVELDGEHNTVADAIALRANELGGLYVRDSFVDVRRVGGFVEFSVERGGWLGFDVSLLNPNAKLVPFVNGLLGSPEVRS